MIEIIKIDGHPHGEWMAVLVIGERQWILEHYMPGSCNFDWWREKWMRDSKTINLPFNDTGKYDNTVDTQFRA